MVRTSTRGKVWEQWITNQPGTVRRHLVVLQAAVNWLHANQKLLYPVKLVLPTDGRPRDIWLTRDEVAGLILHAEPHVRRFIVLALYSGRRERTILALTWRQVKLYAGGAFIDFRRADGEETKKRRGKVRAPRQLRTHLGIWKRRWPQADEPLVAWKGARIDNIRKGLRRAGERAGLDKVVTPHVLKHTAITWAVMTGLSTEAAAEYFHTSAKTIKEHYWHHSPLHQAEGLAAIENGKAAMRAAMRGENETETARITMFSSRSRKDNL